MKKLLLILLTVLAIVSLVSCTENENEKEPDKQNSDPDASITECIDVPYQEDLSQYITIERDDYFGIEVKRFDATVTDDDISEAIYKDLAEHSSLNPVIDRDTQMGDVLNIDFAGYMDGISIDGASAEGADFPLGTNDFIPGFNEALVGHRAGDSFTFDLVFPETYSEKYAGKTAQFEVTINSISEIILPELTNDFVSRYYNCENTDEYLNKIKEELIVEKALLAEQERSTDAFLTVYNNVEIIDFPQDEIDYYYNDFVSFYTELAKKDYGISLEKYLENVNSTEDEFYYYAEENAKNSVAHDLIIFSIANKENLWQDLKRSDYDAFVAKYAAEENMSISDYESHYGEENIWISLILEEVIDFILDNSIEVEATEEISID